MNSSAIVLLGLGASALGSGASGLGSGSGTSRSGQGSTSASGSGALGLGSGSGTSGSGEGSAKPLAFNCSTAEACTSVVRSCMLVVGLGLAFRLCGFQTTWCWNHPSLPQGGLLTFLLVHRVLHLPYLISK